MASDFDRFVEELEQRVIAQARAVYSDEDPAADHGSGDTEDGACLRYRIAGELEWLRWRKNMPIYEYRCEVCGEAFEVFVRSPSRQAVPICPKCGSQKVKKAFSLFGVGGAVRSNASGASCAPGST